MKRFLLILALVPALTQAQVVRSFTDADYQEALRRDSRILFYSFSPSMPLSLEGLAEIRRAADALHATLIPLADPAASESEIVWLGDSRIRFQTSARLRDLGIQLHYPSLVVSNDHKLVGSPIEGFKTSSGYVTLVSDLLKLPWKEEFQALPPIALPRSMNAFFKPLYGTDLIVSGNAYPNFLFNLKTREVWDISSNSNWGDPGPTPDGDFVTLLSGRGLTWHSTSDILDGNNRIALLDPGLRTYQSVGQLSPSTYRVLGALSSSTSPTGLIVRDFESKRDESGRKTIGGRAEWHAVCDGKRISIPMMSKTGLLLSGSFQESLRVFRIGPDATECEEVFDTKAVTGKADFSRDDSSLVYVARSENPLTGISVDTVFLADLHEKMTKPIYYADPGIQLAFPGFLSRDQVVAHNISHKSLFVLDRGRKIE